MAKAYEDDLRRKFLAAYDDGNGTLEELAELFGVSVGWAKKVSSQRKHSGQAERVVHRPGRKPHVGAKEQKQVIAWVEAEPDLTLAEVQAKLHNEASVELSLGRIWFLLRKLGLRLKKSRSMPVNAIPKRTASDAKNLSPRSRRQVRNG